MTLKPSGTLITCMSHEYSSAAESQAVPVFRQLGHLTFSTQLSRAILKYAPRSRNVPMSLRRQSREQNRATAKARTAKRHHLGPAGSARPITAVPIWYPFGFYGYQKPLKPFKTRCFIAY